MKRIILSILFNVFVVSAAFCAQIQQTCLQMGVDSNCNVECSPPQCLKTTGVASANGTCSISETCVCMKTCTYICEEGYYGGGVLAKCTACPANATCPGGNFLNPASTFTCNTGYEKNDLGMACVASSATTQCPDGSYLHTYNGATACATCPANATCVNNELTCNTGYYKYTGQQSSYSMYFCCLNNATCDVTGNFSHCNDGYYGDATNGCKTCPTNATCNGGATFTCKSGYTKQSSFCCLNNATCDNAGNFLRCNNDYYGDATNGCKTCPTNATCNGGATFTCKSGYTKQSSFCCLNNATCDNAGNFSSCNNGYYGDATNGCKKCPTNADCTNGPKSFKCNAGYYKNGNACSVCPANSQTCPAGSTEFKCKENYYKSGSVCKACPSNATCPAGSTDFTCNDGTDRQANGTCKACGESKVCEDQKCKYCANGYYGTCDSGCTQCPSINGSNGFSVSMYNGEIYNSTIAGCYAGATPGVTDKGEYVCDGNGAECLTDELGTYYFDSSDFNMAPWGQNEKMYGTCRATAQ